MASGDCTVTPGKVFSLSELWTRTKLNLLGLPVVRLNAASVGSRELIPADIRTLFPPLNRNLLNNGNFDVWQRGGYTNIYSLPAEMGLLASLSQFTADRWLSVNNTAAVSRRSITRQEFTAGQTAVPNEPKYFLRYQQLISDAASTLGQPIEDVRTMAGQRLTLTWWMKSSNYSGAITARLEQFLGGVPGPAAIIATTVSGGTAILAAGAAWTQYTAIFDVPALAAAIAPEQNALVLRFLLPTGTWIIDFAQVQLEQGDGATSFEYRPYLAELTACERYYEFHCGIFSTDVTIVFPCFYFATRKYKDPALTFVSAPGVGGAVSNLLLPVGYYQSVANSTRVQFTLNADAEIYR